MMLYSSFKNLSNDEKLTYLTKLRSETSIKDILEEWGITRPVYYAIAHEIGLPLKRKGSVSSKNAIKPESSKQDTKGSILMASAENDTNDKKFTLSLDTIGPVSLVSNILSFIGEMRDKEVRVKMEVEVM